MDLFDHWELLPPHILEIIDNLPDGLTYEECKNLVIELEANGYTCDYGLDAVPYNLRHLNT